MRHLHIILSIPLLLTGLMANAQAVNDEPCNAILLPVGPADPVSDEDCYADAVYSYSGATNSAGIPDPTCIVFGDRPMIRDVWYKCIVPPSGCIQYTSDAITAVYTGTDCNGPLTMHTCDAGSYYQHNLNHNHFVFQTPGSVMYFRIIELNPASTASGSFHLCITDFVLNFPTIDNNTRIGVGLNNPYAKLDVAGTAIFRDQVIAGNNLQVRGNLILDNTIQRRLPTQSLQIAGSLETDSLSIGYNRLGNKISLFNRLKDSQQYGLGIQNSLLQVYTAFQSDDIAFGYGNSNAFTETMRIKGDGNVGIGVSDPVFMLDVGARMRLRSSPGNTAGIWLNNEANTESPAFIGMRDDSRIGFYGNGSPNNGWGLIMSTTDGKVGIGTDIPDEALHVVGNVYVTGTLTQNSDIRLKREITPLNNTISSINALQAYRYYWNPGGPDTTEQIGFLAQELQQYFPQLVKKSDAGILSINYSGMVPVLLQAIKEQQAEIEAIKAEIKEMKKPR